MIIKLNIGSVIHVVVTDGEAAVESAFERDALSRSIVECIVSDTHKWWCTGLQNQIRCGSIP